jgi:Arc/MetJ-type ribon-helix-helix transcriptional regulator
MSVDISPDLERRISNAILAGRFASPEELVETAVRRLLEAAAESKSNPSPRTRLSLDPPLIPPAGRRIDLTNEQIYDLIELA